MLKHIPLPAVIVDIETTGGNVTYDRITEIGIVEVTEEGVTEWSTLINPRVRIPEMIQRLTGITNEMVESAPYFEQVAKEILLRLKGKLFVAHNVRFDYGFIRNEFSRLAYTFSAPLMCTVKLSRALYAEHDGHSLEKIIARHQIFVTSRHRALDDAKATFKFMQIAEEEHGEKVKLAIGKQNRKESLPPGFDPELVKALPNSPGVYYFWGEKQELLYIGKSINIRKRVLSHFTADHKSSREMKLCQQTQNVTFDITAGELTALILESQKIKELQPIYNRRLRRVTNLYSIQLAEAGENVMAPQIVSLAENQFSGGKLYGLYPSEKKAKETIQAICDQHGLCYQLCGLERPSSRACTSHQLKKCAGYCVGTASVLIHNVKMLQGFAAVALKAWPYDGPVALVEPNQSGENTQHLLINNWRILGVAQCEADYADILEGRNAYALDKDVYKYLVNAILGKASKCKIYPLTLNLP